MPFFALMKNTTEIEEWNMKKEWNHGENPKEHYLGKS